MVIAGLLLIALVCLVVGLMMQSSVWLIASLIATAGAGFLLYKLRAVVTAPRPPVRSRHSGEAPDAAARSADTGSTSAAAPASPARVWVIDGRPRYHLGDCAIIKGQDAEEIPFKQASEDGFMACSLCEPQAARR